MSGHVSTQNNIQSNGEPDTARFERMLNLSHSAMVSLDADFKIQSVSSSIKKLITYDADWLIGRTYTDFIVSNFHNPFFKLLNNDQEIQLDYPLLNKEGEWCWVRHSGERIKQNDTIRYEFIIQDVSHYKRPHSQVETERNMLRQIMNNMPVAVYATDTGGQFIFSNRAYADLLGQLRSSDVLKQTYRDLFSEALSRYFESQDKSTLTIGTSTTGEIEYLGDDKDRWLNTGKTPMHDDKGNISGLIGIIRDITDEKHAQQRLASSEARHRALLDALPDMMLVIRRDGIITEFRSTPEVESLDIDETVINTPIKESAFPQPLIDEVFLYLEIDLDYQYVHSFEFDQTPDKENGSYYEARLVRLNDEEIMALVRNITPFRRIQDELNRHIRDLNIVRQVNVELSASLNDDYVSQLALDAALRLSNAQAGYLAMAQPSGTMTLKDVFGEYNIPELETALNPVSGTVARVIKSRQPELIFDVYSDDDYVPLLDNTVAMMVNPLISNEQIVGVLVLEARSADRFSHDRFQFLQLITGRIAAYLDNAIMHRQTEEQYKEMRELEQLKTDMIRIASHDLKNPIAGIMGYLEMFRLDMTGKLTEKEQSYLDKIETASQKMQRITSGILSLERIQQLSQQQELKSINLKQGLNRSVSEQMDYAVGSKQTLNRHLPEYDVFIMGDLLQIQEALANLISNAIKYTPEQGTVDVSLSVENGIAKVRVVDTGYGIPVDQQERLFSPFFRALTNETRLIEGTGLGLHLVKNIIERHNGQMVFESEYGKGSTFGFDIPAISHDLLDETDVDVESM